MTSIQQSTRRYETWLREQLKGDLVKQDLARKHDKMKDSAFSFLRATYWRWAETILDVCPDLADAKTVLAVGDIHFENYGTWRDVDGRLVWGVNDYDEFGCYALHARSRATVHERSTWSRASSDFGKRDSRSEFRRATGRGLVSRHQLCWIVTAVGYATSWWFPTRHVRSSGRRSLR